MSLCSDLRNASKSKRHGDLTTLTRAQSTALHALYKVHRVVQNNQPISALFHSNYDPDNLSDDEATFLQENDISCGRFDPSTTLTLRLSPPAHSTPQHHDAQKYASQHSSAPTEATDRPEKSTKPNATAVAGLSSSTIDQSTSLDPVAVVANRKLTPTEVNSDAVHQPKSSNLREPASLSGNVAVSPETIVQPLPEDKAHIPEPAQEIVDMKQPPRPTKAVHLPPQTVQEERSREREAGEEQRRSDAEPAKSQRLHTSNEVASSPSSTVGAYSAATPGPPLDSPDTSPDSESAQAEVPPPKDLQPSPEQQREKEEHDRILAAQKEIARKEALGDLSVAETPDDQLRWEEREADAREAEERAAREDGKGPEPDSKDRNDLTQAGEVVEEIEADAAGQEETSHEENKSQAGKDRNGRDDGDEQDQNSYEEEQQADTTMQDDADTIAVATRKAPLQVDTSSRRSSPAHMDKHSMPATSRREGMTTRVSSGVLRQKSVSEILGHSHSDFSPIVRKHSSAISPLTRRHPSDFSGHPSIEPLLPVQATRSSRVYTHHRTSSTLESAMDQLAALKGAAEDPERDYLEPLFRIQAHDSPNTRTKALPDLVKVGAKTLSTEDHFTAVHERLDFRMLRRIYQLQNANKWSLRQMEKCKEPDEPISHHDHMMSEMKWMRKDFKAEGKYKKSQCAWLAARCAEWVAADGEERRMMQVKIKPRQSKHASHTNESSMPELEHTGDSAEEDDGTPPTPRAGSPLRTTLVVAPELAGVVEELRKSGELSKALKSLPTVDWEPKKPRRARPTAVSRFVEGKVLPKPSGPKRKRSRYDYEDEAELLELQPHLKRAREDPPPEVSDCALFHADNKPIRDRLHSNNAFRPPSEFLMPSVSFYECRNGSQWIWEDDQKLRKLAKEYSFNWSLIADEMALPTRYKSSAERRTPWECFERWVELESLPADMRKTVYFKTWFSRLEVSQQAAEKRYQAQVASIQQAATASGGQPHIPPRRRTIPTRVEKRRSTRYLWMVEGFRKLAKKREQAAWKQAETARAAAQRKSQSDNSQAAKVKMTPQEFSKKRHERDLQLQEMQRQQRQKQLEAQARNIQLARQAHQQAQQQGMPNGAAQQQRPGGPMQPGALQPSGQQPANANGMVAGTQQARTAVRNGQLAPQVNGQGIPQAQMQARAGPTQHPSMQLSRNPQYSAQQYQMANGNMPSPGGMATQQHLAQNQALAAAYPQQQQLQSSPSMPPPPTPQNGSAGAQQLSSGTTPIINTIKTQLRAQNPNMAQDQLDQLANQTLVKQYNNQARQSAMNAAAGIPGQGNVGMQQFPQAQTAYQGNRQMQPSGMYANVNGGAVGEGNNQTAHIPNPSPQTQQQQAYKQSMQQQQQYSAMRMMQMQSPNPAHVSPALSHASPNMTTPASPSMQQYPNMSPMVPGMNGQPQARPTSRSNTPQMQRVGSSGSGINGGMQSPGALQGSPRNLQANMARS